MPFSDNEYDPETIAFLQQCLDIATGTVTVMLGVVPGPGLRNKLALAILEGSRRNIHSREDLIDFALNSLDELTAKPAS